MIRYFLPSNPLEVAAEREREGRERERSERDGVAEAEEAGSQCTQCGRGKVQ